MTKQSTFPPKAFQSSTIRAVLRNFDSPLGSRRFLVADEAGLGKTVVARGVIKEMVERSVGRPLTVFYVCNNQAIASQNMHQLVAFLDAKERSSAMTKADRPGLIPLFPEPIHRRLHLYPITPGTLSSSARRGRGRGKVQERALVYALIELKEGTPIPWLRDLLSWNTSTFQYHVTVLVSHLRNQALAKDRRTKALYREFHLALNDAFQISRAASALPTLKHMEAKVSLLTAICLNALAAAALSGLAPDLAVFDEFQRFRDLMRESSASHDESPLARLNSRILNIVTGGIGNLKLLLLSATPYEALRASSNSGSEIEQNDFFAVLDFLHYHLPNGAERSMQVRAYFDVIGTQMRQGLPLSEPAVAARAGVTALLNGVMCRTERSRYGTDVLQVIGPEVVESPLLASDIRAFRIFEKSLRREDRYWAVPLWTSVPLPAQMLGAKYVCWKYATPPARRADSLSASNITKWVRPTTWPNVKVRSLLKALPTSSISMPWVRPSSPWWPLRGGWAGEPSSGQIDSKVLVFSRFAAVPGAVAAVTSFNLECELRSGKTKLRASKYGAWSKHKYTTPQARHEVFQLFFISTLLVKLDPLAEGIPTTRRAARKVIGHQLKDVLGANKVRIDRATCSRPIAIHLLLIALSRHFGFWSEERAAWCAALAGPATGPTEKTVNEALQEWEKSAPKTLTTLSLREFKALVELALDSPGIVMARALQRHWPEALSSEFEPLSSKRGQKSPSPRQAVQALAAKSLREYIDRPWFAAALGEGAKNDYAATLRISVLDGNFESVLDEHFWLLSVTSSESWLKRIDELSASLELNGGRTVVHKPTMNGENARIRCHVALPLHQAKTSDAGTTVGGKPRAVEEDLADKAPRPEQVRHAFNTPFWPNVLVTTSVGQEGLDFHPWCRSIAHWDPARGPVELEQREGRVDRYAGLSIRRALAANPACTPATLAGSVWSAIGRLAEHLKNSNEMAPWWQVDGAKTVQFYLTTPGSREAETIGKLERSRALYRMLIGVSDPEHLLAQMESQGKVSAAEAIEATLRLGAWDREQQEE